MECGAGAIACRSACEAFGEERYCCSGAYDTPGACKPTAYSSIFKAACPRAYSYAYDDSTSTFTCNAADYTVAFCLPTSGSVCFLHCFFLHVCTCVTQAVKTKQKNVLLNALAS